jgi:hypothetical protein
MPKRRWWTAWWVGCLFLVSCDSTEHEQDILVGWLECDECSDGELDSLLAVAARKPDDVVKFLKETLLAGPEPSSRTGLRSQLERRYQELRAYSRSYPEARVPVDSTVYVTHYLDNSVALYRIRAAHGLGRIGTPAARAALQAALAGQLATPGDTLREDVTRAIQIADSIAAHGVGR